jgi:penicillin amidase
MTSFTYGFMDMVDFFIEDIRRCARKQNSLSFDFIYLFIYLFFFLLNFFFFLPSLHREGEDVYYYRRGNDTWLPVKVRKETILRKGLPSVELTILEANHCVLETRPLYDDAQIPSGLYVCRAWSDYPNGGVGSLESNLKLGLAKTVREGQDILQHITLSANHLLIDSQGNIGYQQSGVLPKRRS